MYMNQPDSTQLYLLTRNWQSDVSFYLDKLRFFRHFVDQKLIWLQDEKLIKELQILQKNLLSTVRYCQKINDDMKVHLAHYQELNENPFSHNEEAFRTEHDKLEKQVTEFTRDFRLLKKDVIDLVEKVTESHHNELNV